MENKKTNTDDQNVCRQNGTIAIILKNGIIMLICIFI